MRILLPVIAAIGLACSGDGSTSLDEPLGNPNAIDIGFNMGHNDQFGYMNDFLGVSSVKDARLCHTYAVWNVGSAAAVPGDPKALAGTRAWLTDWFSKAQGKCDEVLVSFGSHVNAEPPSPAQVETAFEDFLASSWPYTGKLAFTPWNEPNNQFPGGNGLGEVIPPDLAAEYYLTMEEACRGKGCTVAAGDFASNGNWWNDFEWNCANDNVAPADLCKTPSPVNTTHKPASYLDRYKNYISNFASGKASPLGRKHHLPSGFRPGVFAFHGWHDINEYTNHGNHCSSYDDCATRRVLKSLGGSWMGVQIWDTEVGVDQDGPPVTDADQACGAAFLVRLSALSSRITRVYYTRLHGGSGELIRSDHSRRDAANVLAHRQTTFGGKCK